MQWPGTAGGAPLPPALMRATSPQDGYGPPPGDAYPQGGYGPPPGDAYPQEPPPADGWHPEESWDGWAPPPEDPHPDQVLIESKPGELRKQSDRDHTVFEDYIFRLADHEHAIVLEFWDETTPTQSVQLESRCITRIFKGFDESQHEHTKGAIGLQLNYSLFPALRSREKHLRIKFTSISTRSQWLAYLIEGTGLTPEDPHEHLHASPTKPTPPPASFRAPQEMPMQGAAQSTMSHSAAQPSGHDSSDDEYQAPTRRPQRTGWDDDESSDSVIEGVGVGVGVGADAARREGSPTAKTSRAWWQDKHVPPWELEASYQQQTTRQSVAAQYRPGTARVDIGDIRSEVASLQLHRASRTAQRQVRPDGLTGEAKFARMQNLDSRLSELQRRREQRMSQRDGGTMRVDMAVPPSSRPTARSRSLAARGSGGVPSSRLVATRRTMPSGARSVSPDYHTAGVQSSLSEDLHNVRAKRAQLESKLASMQAQRASRSVRMSAASASGLANSTLMVGEGGARVRAKRLHISLSAGPEYLGTSAPTKVLFDPTISVGAFDRLLRCVSVVCTLCWNPPIEPCRLTSLPGLFGLLCRRQLGINPQQYISLANERDELMTTAEALGLSDGALLYLRHDSPPPSPPGSDLDMEEGEPPSPPPSLNGDMRQTGFDAGHADEHGYDGFPGDMQLPGEGQYDQAGEWHAGALDESGVWQEAEDGWQQDASWQQDEAGAQFLCVRKQQAYSAFDPAEKGGRRTEKVKKGQMITAIETRELYGKHGTTLRIHYEGGWVSQTAGNQVCFVRK